MQRRERNKAFVSRGGAKEEALVEGTVLATTPSGVIVSLGEGATGLIGKNQISGQPVESAVGLLAPGTKVRAVVLRPKGTSEYDIFLSTKVLEPSPGDMLHDPQLVYDGAEEMAEAWRSQRKKRSDEMWERRQKNLVFIHECGFQGRKLHEGVVVEVKPQEALVELAETGGATAILSKEEISHEHVVAAGDVLKVGDKVRACLLRFADDNSRRIFITTKPLETVPGGMLRNPGLVYEQAGTVFEAWLEKAPKQEDLVEGVVTGISKEGEIAVAVEGGYRGTVGAHDVDTYAFGNAEDDARAAKAEAEWKLAAGHAADYDASLSERLKAVISVGDKVKAMILPGWYPGINPLELPLNTSCLEVTSGDMLRNPQLVYATAEEMAAKRRLEWQRRREEAEEKKRAVEAAWERNEQARVAAIAAMKEGDLLEGRIHRNTLFEDFLMVSLHGQPKKIRGLIRRSEISHEAVGDWKSLYEALQPVKIKALVIKADPDNCRVLLSTKALEPTPGDMLRDPQLVYDRAEEMAAAWREKRKAAQAAGKQADA